MHHGHQGIHRCWLRVAFSVLWPRLTNAVEQFVQSCQICLKLTTVRNKPLLSTLLPTHPWERIAADLFELKGFTYLLVANYFPDLWKCHS